MKNLSIILCLIILLTIGCSNRHKPNNFPQLYPYTFTVLLKGEPVEKAKVMFLPEQSGQSWVVVGETNSQGIAVIYTHQGSYMESGIPAGTFNVTISKEMEIKQLPKEEKDKMNQEEAAKYIASLRESMKESQKNNIVPTILSDHAKTPLKITVGETDNAYTVNLEQYK
jgi:hypothetical protein